MSVCEKQINALKEAISGQNYFNQIRTISHIFISIKQSPSRKEVIEELISFNVADAINDVICTKLTILLPSMKLVRYLMENFHFRSYLFQPILKNILRSLIFYVQSDEIGNFQLEFFEIIAILDILITKFLSNNNNITRKSDDGMQATFVCILNFLELVLSSDGVDGAVKNLMVEIYLHILKINEIFKCISNIFERIIKVANVGEEFLKRFKREYEKDQNELWLYKIMEVLLRIFESFILSDGSSDSITVKVFENIFNAHIAFVLEQFLLLDLTCHHPELFKLCISILNAVLWTKTLSQQFCSRILKTFVRLNGDSVVICMSKSSKKIFKNTTYAMKIFLTAFVCFAANSPHDKHKVLHIFLQSRLFDMLFELERHEVLKNHKALILLYGCSFIKHKLCNPLNARAVLENVVLIVNRHRSQLDKDEIWTMLRVFALCSSHTPLSELEYAGVQQMAEKLIGLTSTAIFDIKTRPHTIDKYSLIFVKKFSSDTSFVNFVILLYLSQKPKLTSSKVGPIIPAYNILPLLISSDRNQVENALKMLLHQNQLTEEDLTFVVDQCFGSLKVEEEIIGGLLNLIGSNRCLISQQSSNKIYSGTIAFLQTKQVRRKLSKECYMCIVKSCVSLAVFKLQSKSNDVL